MSDVLRQGDVCLYPREEAPENLIKQDNLILAYGEVTGHRHQIISGKANLYKEEGEDHQWLEVTSPTAVLAHGDTTQLDQWKRGETPTAVDQPHDTLTLEEGLYKIRIQREYEPEGWAYVAD